jgi:hypothetical protein
VNFQQAGQRVEDGQHLSFVGTIMSSRYFSVLLFLYTTDSMHQFIINIFYIMLSLLLDSISGKLFVRGYCW